MCGGLCRLNKESMGFKVKKVKRVTRGFWELPEGHAR